MKTEDQERVCAYLETWDGYDWDDVLDLMTIMPLPEALVEIHRRKLGARPAEVRQSTPEMLVADEFQLILL